jgi:hypothetical protein
MLPLWMGLHFVSTKVAISTILILRELRPVLLLPLFTKVPRKDEFSEVRGSKRRIGRSAKHSTTAWRHPCGVETLRLGSSSCTFLYQGVATRNGATT